MLLALILLSVVHCSKKQSSPYIQVPAPTHEDQLGLIVTASEDEVAQIAAQKAQASIRALSVTHNLYEIANVSEAELKPFLRNKSMHKNILVKAQHVLNEKPLNLKSLAMNTSPDAEEAIKTCQVGEKSPEMEIDIDFNPETLTINLGEEVTIKVTGKAHADVGGEVRFFWDILPPGFSEQALTQGIANEQKIKPDSVGLYRVAIVAQGVDTTCALQVVPIFVTANPALSNAANLAKVPDQAIFKHIQQISAPGAWAKSKGQGITVAVLDTGLNYNHPSIRDNLKIKQKENDGDKADSDGNSLPDDFIGWDFVNADNMPFDDQGHGSHVSGLVASPLAGIAPQAKILPIKVLNAGGGTSDMGTIIAGIMYAVDNGAQIINASLGVDNMKTPPQPMKDALEYARNKNVLFMAAAGNNNTQTNINFNIEEQPTYPASFEMDNVIAVAATAVGEITGYSNFSDKLVHFGAPGGNEKEFVLSLSTQNPKNSAFAAQVGTSMATPVAAGAAALILSANSHLSPKDVRTILMETGDDMASLKGKTISGKQINVEKAVAKALDLQPVSSMN